MDTLTINDAIKNIGLALAHDSLKLSQREHLALVKSFQIIQKALELPTNPDQKKEDID